MSYEPTESEVKVGEYYAQGRLLDSIESALAESGLSRESAGREDLVGVDEFHFGGRRSTELLCEQLGLTAETALLDIGSGIGGPARHIAAEYGSQVTGLDLTPEFVDVATALTNWVGLQTLVHFETGSALRMPFGDDSFDVVTQLHVGMNIADKGGLFAEVARVLRPGGLLGVYDIMSASDDGHEFPVPWATRPASSHVASPDIYAKALKESGFGLVSIRDRTEEAMGFTVEAINAAAGRQPSAMTLGLLLGPDVQTKLMNLVGAIGGGALAPVEIICRKL